MPKIYTAQAMREMANREKFKCSFVTRTLNGGIILDCTSDVCAMLRQAADLMEREERRELKYEYSVRYFNRYEKKEEVDYLHHTTSTAAARYLPWFQEAKCVVRRPVGEWEEVRDGK